MSEENTNKSGKGKGILGFILSLVSLLLGGWLMSALFLATKGSAGAAGIVLVLPILGLIFSVMGMKASKAAGEKRGLAIAGLVIAIVSLVWLGLAFTALGVASSYIP
jgi:hypothetical protein